MMKDLCLITPVWQILCPLWSLLWTVTSPFSLLTLVFIVDSYQSILPTHFGLCCGQLPVYFLLVTLSRTHSSQFSLLTIDFLLQGITSSFRKMSWYTSWTRYMYIVENIYSSCFCQKYPGMNVRLAFKVELAFTLGDVVFLYNKMSEGSQMTMLSFLMFMPYYNLPLISANLKTVTSFTN